MDTNKRVTMLACDLLSVPEDFREGFLAIHQKFESWIANEGAQGLKRSKEIYSYAVAHLLGEDLPHLEWTAKSRRFEGSLKILDDIYPYLLENPREGLTLLRYSDLYLAELSDENCINALEPIVSPYEGTISESEYSEIVEYSTRFMTNYLKVEIGSVPMFSKGPNGISLLSVWKDSISLHSDGILQNVIDLGNKIVQINPNVKRSALIESITDRFTPGKYPDVRTKSGRLVFLPEKSGKIRVIAQGDYISQSTLKPLHDTLAGILRQIPGDWMFDQEGGKRWVQMKTANVSWCASYDLSNATDRLPINLQADIIDRVLPGNLGSVWKRVISDRQFSYTLPSGKEGSVSYSVGQPMGFYSSFVAFALLHHVVVNYAYEKAHGRPGRNFYAIIGDDIVITDKAAGQVYIELIRKIGGVINLKKSRISNSKGNITAEFAKAYFRNGIEFTPYSLRAIKDALSNWVNVPKVYNDILKLFGTKRALRAKKLKLMFQKYWPKETNTLVQLLEVPVKFGGFGKPGHTPLVEILRGKSNTFRRFLAYRALEAYNVVVDVSDEQIQKATGNIVDRSDLSLALQPLLKLLRDRSAEIGIPSIVTSRKGFLEWAMSRETTLSSLISCVTLLTKDSPTSLREKVNRPSVMWVRAVADDKRTSEQLDSDNALFNGYLEFTGTA